MDVGFGAGEADSNTALAVIEDLGKRGFPAVWMTSGSASGGASLSVFAAAASRTQQIMLGTAITQIFPRHPIAWLSRCWCWPSWLPVGSD